MRNYGQREKNVSEILGQNSRLDELQASILRIQLRKLDEWNLSRRKIAEFYRKAFMDLPLGMQAETGQSNYHLFVVTTPHRDELRSYLLSQDIPALVHYPVPLNRQKAFLQFNPPACPNAELLCSRVLSLPIHPFISSGDAERVIDAVRRFFKGSRKTEDGR
jgi:dTDP-4-amino-4,6-dideoxygalactose transaminase